MIDFILDSQAEIYDNRRATCMDDNLEVERIFGRDRDREIRWGPRRLDLDLIAFGDIRCSVPGLDLPHPRAQERPFVMGPSQTLPLEEIPGSIREIVRSFPSQWPKEQQGQEVFQCS